MPSILKLLGISRYPQILSRFRIKLNPWTIQKKIHRKARLNLGKTLRYSRKAVVLGIFKFSCKLTTGPAGKKSYKKGEAQKTYEIWLCFSSISYILFSCYKSTCERKDKVTRGEKRQFLCLGRSPSNFNIHKLAPSSKKSITTQYFPRKSSSRLSLLQLLLLKHFQGYKIVLRLPHLSEWVIGPWLREIINSSFAFVEFYDDGLFGCIGNPTVLHFYPESISKIVHWNIAGWKPPIKFGECRHLAVDLEEFASFCQINTFTQKIRSAAKVIIIEAKYMDYKQLNYYINKIQQSANSTSNIFYFEHPSFHKRNSIWHSESKRNIINNEQCESWLLTNLSSQCHVLSAVTSSVVFACELVKQKLIQPFKLTLLINKSQVPSDMNAYYNYDEALDFYTFIEKHYSGTLEINCFIC